MTSAGAQRLRRQGGVMADRFGAVAKTCVPCHSVYLHSCPDKLR